METIIKLIFTLAIIGATKSHFLTKKEVVTRVCHGDERCIKGAAKCLEAIKPTDQEFKRISTAFDSCVTSLQMENVLADFYNSPISDSSIADGQNAHRETLYMYLPFIEFLEMRDVKAATDFRCCFGRATNSLDKHNNINKTYFKSKITQKVLENQDALKALLSAVDTCSAQTLNCDGHNFRTCFVETCSKAMRV